MVGQFEEWRLWLILDLSYGTKAATTHVPTAMTAPLRRSGITPKVRTTGAASRAILINASIVRICACRRTRSSALGCRNQTDPLRVTPHDTNGMPFRLRIAERRIDTPA